MPKSLRRKPLASLTPSLVTLAEALERRQLLSAAIPASIKPIAMKEKFGAGPNTETANVYAPATGQATPGPGFTPTQLRTAYGLGTYGSSPITFSGQQATGAGETIAIVDNGDDPYAATDLNTFSSAFGLPLVNQSGGPSFTKLNQTGGTTLPGVAAGWTGEESLDIEWFHAFAPQANIILFEASTSLDTAVETAAAYPGVVLVSMSYGGGESSGNTGTNSEYTTPAGHTGVTFLAATGDGGAGVEYPAASPNVVAVGGTTLNLNSNNTWNSEAGWSGSGGGVSAYETQPNYQKGAVSAFSTTQRTIPDVSIDAGSGVPICDSYDNGTSTPWLGGGYVEIGTSLATPLMGAIVTLADQGRAIHGQQSLNGPTQTLPALYQLNDADFHDITSINNGTTVENGGTGYDLNTGRGTPIGNLLIPDLAAVTTATTFTSTDIGSPSLGGSAITSSVGTTVTGSGSDIWLTSDQFHYDYQSVSGNGSIAAEVTVPMLDTDGVTSSFAAKAGVMYRNSTAANAPFVDMVYTNGLGIQLIYRTSAGANAVQAGPNISASGPLYLKASCTGTTYSGWYSSNGTSWTLDSTCTDSAVGTSALAGLVACSHDNTKLMAATFSNVAVLSSGDIGSPGIAGSSSDTTSGLNLTGSGSDIWNASDQFHFDDQAVANDGSVEAELNTTPVLDTDGTQSFAAKGGVMYRASSAANAAFVDLVYTNGIGIQLLYRTSTGATAVQAGSNISYSGAVYLKLIRIGSTYTGYYSSNGTSWTVVSSCTDSAVGSTAFAGVVACSHDNTKLATTTYSDVAIGVL
jgi:hypothetical protein